MLVFAVSGVVFDRCDHHLDPALRLSVPALGGDLELRSAKFVRGLYHQIADQIREFDHLIHMS